MNTVCVAGATGYLGRFLVAEFRRRGWQVLALVRDRQRAQAGGLVADALIEAQATERASLSGVLGGVDLVVSALGITRQRDGLSYCDVDYRANLNLLEEALDAGVGKFAYVHVLGAASLPEVALVAAKQAFVDKLRTAPIASCVISPSGYFSDMQDFLGMARSGRVWLFGDGSHRINPIHGADLAAAIADAIEAGRTSLEIGGPDILSHRQIAELAFAALDKPARITCLPDWPRRAALWLLPRVTPLAWHGPVQFFLAAMGQDVVGEPHGTHRLEDFFRQAAGDGTGQDAPQ